ncbi:protein Abitram [Strongylocentrotus purpuratus]|uniref:Protein Abitram n=1 Tax=Strongylocentrotus purpuratus TaxID=7668 RepID=A0A7M7P5K8_STRPU|nr:protein Abitram [Strongylocentrotus purpuratus]
MSPSADKYKSFKMAASMVQSVTKDKTIKHEVFPSFLERYFTAKYQIDTNGKTAEDFCILQHSNKICVITVAGGHPIVRDKMKVEKVDFQVTANTNRMDNKVIGKNKKGAQNLQSESILCKVHCSGGKSYTIYSCIKGKLVEVNEILFSHPQLLVEKPNTEGYVAIILVRLSDYDSQFQRLISEDEYGEVLSSRANELDRPETLTLEGGKHAGNDPPT